MRLNRLILQHFRNHSKADFTFNSDTTLIVGPNTSGKTSLLEAIGMLTTGKSNRSEKDIQAITFGEEISRFSAIVGEGIKLEVMLSTGTVLGVPTPFKRYMVNGVVKRRADFVGNLASVSFSPTDLDLLTLGPSLRRRFLNDVLEQVDKTYSLALTSYEKALRQRNALLEKVRETGHLSEKEFSYWDDVLIRNGNILTSKREAFIGYINDTKKEVIAFAVVYNKSTISQDRLLQYKDAELGAGVTLVGPHRDDFSVTLRLGKKSDVQDVRFFGSRGQSRLVVLQLKLLQRSFLFDHLGFLPLMLLDDIFSELDAAHIHLVLEKAMQQQTILTTTHKELVKKTSLSHMSVIELG